MKTNLGFSPKTKSITADMDKIATVIGHLTKDICPNCFSQRQLRSVEYTRLVDLQIVDYENNTVEDFHGHEGRFFCGNCALASEPVPLIEYNLQNIGVVLLPVQFGKLVQHQKA